MEFKIASDWKNILQQEIEKPYFKSLKTFVVEEYENQICFPKPENIFAAFQYCKYEDLKVVIIGQDPYHGENQADGLCFSVQEEIAIPRSLKNIFKEIQTDLNKEVPENGNLKRWAKQGVLLLNSTLTVQKGKAGSHQRKGWEKFTNAVIKHISENKENIVFLLWGGAAKKKGAKIDKEKHLILETGHPSPLSANRGYWFGNKHFSKTNQYLRKIGKEEINW